MEEEPLHWLSNGKRSGSTSVEDAQRIIQTILTKVIAEAEMRKETAFKETVRVDEEIRSLQGTVGKQKGAVEKAVERALECEREAEKWRKLEDGVANIIESNRRSKKA